MKPTAKGEHVPSDPKEAKERLVKAGVSALFEAAFPNLHPV